MLSCHHQYLSGQLMINSSSSLCVKNQTFLFASSPSMPTAIFKCGLKVIMWQRRRTDVLKLSHTHSPTLSKMPFALFVKLAQANVCPIFTVNLVPRFLS